MDEFPKTYDVPRNGKVVQVSLRNREDLRTVRTELELFRCIRQQLSTPEAAQVYRIPGKYSKSDLQDLKGIASDVHYSSLDELIEQIDGEFTGLREEMTMASVNEEAERIAHEVAESGAAPATEESAKNDGAATSDPAPEPVSKPKPEPVSKTPAPVSETTLENEVVAETDSDPVPGGGGDDRPVHEALVEAEAELARVVGVKPEPVSAPVVDDSCDDESESAASDERTPEEEATCEETANETADTLADSDQQPSTESHEAVAGNVECDTKPANAPVEQPAAVIEVFEEGVSEVAAPPA